jgi:hypothetical protein
MLRANFHAIEKNKKCVVMTHFFYQVSGDKYCA